MHPFPYDYKIVTSDDCQAYPWPRPLVMTNGCFDLLHLGHIDYLSRARVLGAGLVVAVNSDASVRRQNKAPDRPIFDLKYRMRMLAALDCVDHVVFFEDDTPLSLVQSIRPDVLVKGGDWPVNAIVGAKEVVAYGGSVHSLAFHFDMSTTQMLHYLRQDGRV